MEQDVERDEPADPAAVAFEALRREVGLLHAAVAGLTAERASVPDYSETLGEIAKGVAIAVARMGKLASSPALSLSPAEVTQQITAAGSNARQHDSAALRQAQETLQRAAGDLRGWIESARLASVQNWRLVQAALAGLVGGAVLGATLPAVVTQVAPGQWAWPEKTAAGVLHRDMWSAGERMLSVANPERWRAGEAARRIADQNPELFARCVRAGTHKSASLTRSSSVR